MHTSGLPSPVPQEGLSLVVGDGSGVIEDQDRVLATPGLSDDCAPEPLRLGAVNSTPCSKKDSQRPNFDSFVELALPDDNVPSARVTGDFAEEFESFARSSLSHVAMTHFEGV